MGKWSTYRKRGSSTTPAASLSPPPPSVMDDGSGEVRSITPELNNIGGILHLYFAPSPSGPWTLSLTATWERPHTWGEPADFAGLALRSTDIGNGVDYVGESEPSNILDYT